MLHYSVCARPDCGNNSAALLYSIYAAFVLSPLFLLSQGIFVCLRYVILNSNPVHRELRLRFGFFLRSLELFVSMTEK